MVGRRFRGGQRPTWCAPRGIEHHTHPGDQRKIRIQLTDRAQAILDQVLPVVHASATEAFAGLSEVEREPLIGMLDGHRDPKLAAVASRLLPATPKPRRRPPFR